MDNFVIITDGCGDLTKEQRQKFGIEEPIGASIVWPDGVERASDPYWTEISPDEYFQMMTNKKNFFKSSLPAPGKVYEALEVYCKEGKNILVTTLSGGLSGTYNVFLQASKELMEKYGNKIHVVDTRRYGGAIALNAVYASKYRSEGLSFDEVVEKIEALKLTIHQCGVLDDLYYLNRVGRISKTAAVMGTFIGIKPMADFDNDSGKSIVIGKPKGNKNFIKAFKAYVQATIGFTEGKILLVTHSLREENARKMEAWLKETYPSCEVLFVTLGQLNGANVGPGLCATFYPGDAPTSNGCVEEAKVLAGILGK